MEWIHFFDDLGKYLDKDEEILWSRRENHNLLSFLPRFLKTVLILTIFISLWLLVAISMESLFFTIALISIYIIFLGATFLVMVSGYTIAVKTISLDKNQLRNYDFFYVITNKRYIRKDHWYHYKIDLSKYPQKAYAQIGDTVFLEFDYVDEVLANYGLERIFFKVNGYLKGISFFIDFEERDDMEKVMEIIQTVLSLELLEKKTGRKNKDVKLYIKNEK